MRKLLIIIFIIISGITKAQPYVYIPDPVFRDVLDSIAPGCISGTNLNTTHSGLDNVTFLDISYYGISDITGIQYLINLSSINCSHNQIYFVPTLPSALIGLYIGHNNLSNWPVLPPGITSLKIDYNPIGNISAIPSTITNIDISGCGLTSIPALPVTMTLLRCKDNSITSLPALPSNLQLLECQNNSLASLPTLPNSLYELFAAGNGLVCIPNLPTNPSFTSDIGYILCSSQGTPDSWFPKSGVPVSGLSMASCFNIGNKSYLGGGSPVLNGAYFWEFNNSNNAWTQKANIPVQARQQPVGFSIGNKGYLGMGQGTNPVTNNDIWEYNPGTNIWLQKSSYPGTGYKGMASFIIGDNAYVGLGLGPGNTFPTTFYKFNPRANSWSSIAAFPGVGRKEAASFSIANQGYVCAGDGVSSLLATSYKYNVVTGTWSSIASTPSNLNEAATFAINGKGYVSCGQYDTWNGPRRNYLLQYDPVLNTWSSKASLPTLGRQMTTGCGSGGKGFVGTGIISLSSGGSTQTNDWWEYTPTCYVPSNLIFASSGTGICANDSVFLFAVAGNNYQWKLNGTTITGATSEYYYASQNGNYTCAISNSCGSVTSVALNVVVNAPPVATITASGSTTFCAGGSIVLNANTGAGLTYQWKKYGNVIAGATAASYTASSTGNYKVIVTSSGGCSASSNTIIVTAFPLPVATITANGPVTFCPGSSVQLQASTGAGLTYQWKKYSLILAGATGASYIATAAGQYKVIVTNSNGCVKSSNTISVATLPTSVATITAGGPTSFCAGDSVVLTANAGAGLGYQWKNGTVNIAGATNINYPAKVTGNYRCRVTNTNGCTKNSNAIAVSVPCRLGSINNEEIISGISVYPNPSTGDLTIGVNSVEVKEVYLLDNLGNMIYRISVNKHQVTYHIKDIAQGLYFIKTDNGLTTKIVVL